MALISDILLVTASLGLAIYCVVLSRRLNRFTDLEKGVGGAVAVLSAQVDDLTRALRTARETAQGSAAALDDTTSRAEDVARRLELHIAAMHDLPEPGTTPPTETAMPPGNESEPAATFAHGAPFGHAPHADPPDDEGQSKAPGPILFSSQRRIHAGVAG